MGLNTTISALIIRLVMRSLTCPLAATIFDPGRKIANAALGLDNAGPIGLEPRVRHKRRFHVPQS